MRTADAIAIREFVEQRGIMALFHFTRVDNLSSILTHGLLTRDQCAHRGLNAVVNDEDRFDRTAAVCASIGFPNYKMFYRLRCQNRDVEWAVLKLNASVLWQTRSAFCTTNAANASVTRVPLEERQRPDALRAMFDDREGRTRDGLRIPDHFPTDPQAEVLLMDGVDLGYIEGVCHQTLAALNRFRAEFSRHRHWPSSGLFDPRCDYEHWR